MEERKRSSTDADTSASVDSSRTGPVPFHLASPLSRREDNATTIPGRAHVRGYQTPSNAVSTTLPSNERSSDSRRAEVDQQIRDAFRERQRQNKTRQVQHLVLGKGLGGPAETTLIDGFYNPQKVLAPLTDEEKELWQTINVLKVPLTSDAVGFVMDDEDGTNDAAPPHGERNGRLPQGADENEREQEQEPEQPLLEKFRCTYRPVNAILQARAEMEANVDTAEKELDAACSPFLFTEVLDALTTALEVLEDGSATVKVSLPTYCREEPSPDPRLRAAQRERERRDPLFLVGAEAVVQYARTHLIDVAYTLVPLTHTTQWVVQYTVAFLRSLTALTEEEARIRLELLARCVRLVGKTERFSSVLLLLESKIEEYDAFCALRESAEVHIGALLAEVDKMLEGVLSLPFPSRRARLRLVEKGITQKLQRTLLFLNEIDYHWSPNVRFHAEWKAAFLSEAFRRIHTVIAPRFTHCLMGFVDDAVYKLVSDTRVSGKLLGASPVQPQVPMARQIEYERVTEGLTLQQIGMQVKSNASIVVGAQVCMGARYVLRQSTKDFNKPWGFYMDEPAEAPSTKDIEDFMAKVTDKARNKAATAAKTTGKAAGAAPLPPPPPPPPVPPSIVIRGNVGGASDRGLPPRAPVPSTTFLTQDGYE